MPNRLWLFIAFIEAAALGLTAAACRVESADLQTSNQSAARSDNGVAVGVNFNDGSLLRPEFPEHFFRDAASGCWPVPAISVTDLAQGLQPVVLQGSAHALSGGIEKLTDGAGPVDDDEPGDCFFFDNGVRIGRFRISLPRREPIGQINIYSWHRNLLSGGIRAPQRIDVYASDGEADGFAIDDPEGPGYRLLARIDTKQPGGISAQSGQHGSCIHGENNQPLGNFRHFIFQVYPPTDGLMHTFLCEVDVARADVPEQPSSPADVAKARDFDEHVGPLLARRCLACHNASDKKGGLDLSQLAGIRTGGESGPPLEAGSADDSYLLQRVEGDEMPPKHPLSNQEKQTLRDWIAAGATWGSDPIDRFRFTSQERAGYDWWSLQPLAAAAVPIVKDTSWPSNEIDRYVLTRLEAEKLAPSPPADRRTLIRRVTIDLIGLPPTPDEVAKFVADDAPDAYPRLVDRLLASPHYGERWARHWLDVVRFAESQGFERNKFYPSAWKYRDWVIQAFNEDLPYDEFVRWQIAGDKLRPDDPRAIAATGYLVCGPQDSLGLTQGSQAMRANTREDELENVVGNVGQTFLGLTINCARCHDHKFDPLYQREYYQFAAALGGIERSVRFVQPSRAERESSSDVLASAMRDADERLRQELGAQAETLLHNARSKAAEIARTNLDSAQAKLTAAEQTLQKSPDDANVQQMLADRQRDLYAATDERKAAENPYSIAVWDELSSELPANIVAAARPWIIKLSLLEQRCRLMSGGALQSCDSAPARYFHVLARGSFRQPQEVVSARGFTCIKTPTADWGLPPSAPEADRRVQLATWVTDWRNPLIARVIVNRLWHYHFGVGIVDTPNDFGFSGGRPSHPELLDWLAAQLLRNDWSLKHIHRLIVLSATYRQSGDHSMQAAQVDADNRLLWHKTPLRLEAEAVRDAVLAVSGQLNRRMGGPSFRDVEIDLRAENVIYKPVAAFNPAVNRRTVYRTVVRSATPSLLETLDCADPTVATPRRTVTTTPLQALSLLNNPFMVQAAAAFASRAQSLAGDDVDRQIEQVYKLAFARQPTTDELDAGHSYITKFGLADFCLAVFNSNEFVYVD